ncbi:MAG: hypothetical protein ACREU9_06045 [Gammaproteobacteria bacterium]
MDPDDFFARLDKANNDDEVRQRIAGGKYNDHHKSLAQEWLRRREESRASEAATRAESRDEETLSIAREANLIARAASREVRIDRYIAIIAVIIAAIAARDDIVWLIGRVLNVFTP